MKNKLSKYLLICMLSFVSTKLFATWPVFTNIENVPNSMPLATLNDYYINPVNPINANEVNLYRNIVTADHNNQSVILTTVALDVDDNIDNVPYNVTINNIASGIIYLLKTDNNGSFHSLGQIIENDNITNPNLLNTPWPVFTNIENNENAVSMEKLSDYYINPANRNEIEILKQIAVADYFDTSIILTTVALHVDNNADNTPYNVTINGEHAGIIYLQKTDGNGANKPLRQIVDAVEGLYSNYSSEEIENLGFSHLSNLLDIELNNLYNN